jgi:hypothetical protein
MFLQGLRIQTLKKINKLTRSVGKEGIDKNILKHEKKIPLAYLKA